MSFEHKGCYAALLRMEFVLMDSRSSSLRASTCSSGSIKANCYQDETTPSFHHSRRGNKMSLLQHRLTILGQPILTVALLLVGQAVVAAADDNAVQIPNRGICAHRGASDTHPENTISAFREAIRLGAQMIEFDVALSKDDQLVLMHDSTVDRTTNGRGAVSELTLSELQKLDAGSWKNERFSSARIPTLDQTLEIMPENVWLNVHLKGGVKLAEKTTHTLVAHRRLHQSFLACGADAARAAKAIDSRIKICNMDRQANSLAYLNETIAMKADFVQLLGGQSVDSTHTKMLQSRGIRINYCCSNDAKKVESLFKAGVEFPLVDRVSAMLKVADQSGIPRLKPVYRSRLQRDGMATPLATLVEQKRLARSAGQGLALTAEHYFTSTSKSIFRFDLNWKFLEEKVIRIDGVNHLGAIDYQGGFLWGGLLHGPVNGQHDPKLNRSIIAKIRAKDLKIVKTWDITKDVTWIDPVCHDGKHLWVGDLSDLGIHRYAFEGDKLVRNGILRYPKGMHFSQGIRIVNGKLYSIHTFGHMDGLFEFDLPEQLSDKIQHPTRVWKIAENRMHCEGFDFVPGKPNHILHAQGSQVDRYELAEIEVR